MCCYWLNDYCNILQTQLREKLWEQLQEKHLIAVNSEKKKGKIMNQDLEKVVKQEVNLSVLQDDSVWLKTTQIWGIH